MNYHTHEGIQEMRQIVRGELLEEMKEKYVRTNSGYTPTLDHISEGHVEDRLRTYIASGLFPETMVKQTVERAYRAASERIIGYLQETIGATRIDLVQVKSVPDMRKLIERLQGQAVSTPSTPGVTHD